MECEKELDAIDMVIVPALPILKDGTVMEDALGIVVRVQLVSAQLNAPGAGDPAMSNEAEQAIVFVPSALCVTVVVPLAIVQ
jgi:hypothetical protein